MDNPPNHSRCHRPFLLHLSFRPRSNTRTWLACWHGYFVARSLIRDNEWIVRLYSSLINRIIRGAYGSGRKGLKKERRKKRAKRNKTIFSKTGSSLSTLIALSHLILSPRCALSRKAHSHVRSFVRSLGFT